MAILKYLPNIIRTLRREKIIRNFLAESFFRGKDVNMAEKHLDISDSDIQDARKNYSEFYFFENGNTEKAMAEDCLVYVNHGFNLLEELVRHRFTDD
jgi:hypothetical protein